ncbi:hypothetical protein EVAR_63927_1 [Eumeta japonica]|uniref:Uncharacterized protein n=1 Tax=Eumeta variegata TaxID=151549 RepID=A0A4C1ZMJ1_EUMVA|nr:hypothetical protein EVAR_63927_1 [Eumeta japonica]
MKSWRSHMTVTYRHTERYKKILMYAREKLYFFGIIKKGLDEARPPRARGVRCTKLTKINRLRLSDVVCSPRAFRVPLGATGRRGGAAGAWHHLTIGHERSST